MKTRENSIAEELKRSKLSRKQFFEMKYEERINEIIEKKKMDLVWRKILKIKHSEGKKMDEGGPDLSLNGILYFRKLKDVISREEMNSVVKKAREYVKLDLIGKAANFNSINYQKMMKENGRNEEAGESGSQRSLEIKTAPRSLSKQRKSVFEPKNVENAGKQIKVLKTLKSGTFVTSGAKNDLEDKAGKKNSEYESKKPNQYMLGKFLKNLRNQRRFTLSVNETYMKCIVLSFFEQSKQNRALSKYFQKK